ncbi:MAG: pilus assembly protein [Kiritimatiellaeota bacterium]|nr:pilus assembly protein [Kiritimatiellota bacterium]
MQNAECRMQKQGRGQTADDGTEKKTDPEHQSFCILHSAFLISSRGQALIESCIVIGLICLLLMGLFQLAQLFLAQEIMDYAAGRGARAKAVGFNDFMVAKTVRIGAIANAGALTFPEPSGGGPWVQWTSHESPRIPHYLQSDEWELNFILNYALWDTISWSCPAPDADILHFEVNQAVPLMFFSNVFKAFSSASAVPMQGVADIENHYPLYLQ